MKYKKSSLPAPTLGISFIGIKDIVVPDQSMSLEYILKRFTRGEPVAVGHETSEGIQEEDLEKMKHADLVDKAEFKDRLEQVKTKHAEQEARKKKAQKEAAEKKAAEEQEAKVQAEIQRRLSEQRSQA